MPTRPVAPALDTPLAALVGGQPMLNGMGSPITGTGTPGIATALAAFPLTAVALVDREPQHTRNIETNRECWAWWRPGHGTTTSNLPPELWKALLDTVENRRTIPRVQITVLDYPTPDAARLALSAAALAFIRAAGRA